MSKDKPQQPGQPRKPRKYDPPLSLYGLTFEQAVERALKFKPKKKQPPPDAAKA